MNLIPVLTEKSFSLAKEGKYSFWVGGNLTKTEVKSEVLKIFGVNVRQIRTVSVGGELKRNNKGKKVEISKRRKAIVTLKEGQKIDIFEEKKKK